VIKINFVLAERTQNMGVKNSIIFTSSFLLNIKPTKKMIRIKTLAILIITFLALTVKAQDFNGGVLFGLSATEISGDRLEGPNKAGIYAGAFVNRDITDRSSLQMELNLIQKGSRKNPDTLDNSNFYLLRLSYAELFLHYKWDFGEIFTLEAGPSLGILINSYEKADYSVIEDRPFKKPDLSLNLGLFVDLTQKWRLNVRYSNSILAVRPHSRGQTYRWNRGQYNEVLSFTLHYTL
jgi:hypothetical protein